LEAHITTNDIGIAYHLLTYPKIQLSVVGGIVRQIQHAVTAQINFRFEPERRRWLRETRAGS
jgi:DeoR/GlpR family transcriptional regulator of sugar metabolism